VGIVSMYSAYFNHACMEFRSTNEPRVME